MPGKQRRLTYVDELTGHVSGKERRLTCVDELTGHVRQGAFDRKQQRRFAVVVNLIQVSFSLDLREQRSRYTS